MPARRAASLDRADRRLTRTVTNVAMARIKVPAAVAVSAVVATQLVIRAN